MRIRDHDPKVVQSESDTLDCGYERALLRLTRSEELRSGDLVRALRAITEMAADALAVERAGVWRVEDDGSLTCLDLFERSARRHSCGNNIQPAELPNYFAALEAVRSLPAGDVLADPRTAQLARYFNSHSIHSTLDAPVIIDGRVAMVACHEHVGPKRAWHPAEREFAATVADMVALAVENSARVSALAALQSSNDALRRSERRLRALAAVSRAISDARLDVPALVRSAERALSEALGARCTVRLADAPPCDPDGGVDVPLRGRGVLVGVLTIGGGNGAPLDPDWVAEVGERLALALDNARLFEQVAAARTRAEDAEARLRSLNESLERRIEERTRELQAAVRALDAFSGSVAHDLRAPLRTVRSFTRLVLERGEQPPQDRACLERVERAAARMSDLIEDLLRLAHVNATSGGPPVAVDLSALAREVVDELRRGQPSRDVSVEIADGLATRGDPGLLRVLLGNLLGNAWKFTARTTAPRIVVGRVEGTAPPEFFVRDNGAGFDPALADTVFSPLVRLHPLSEYEGTGIGLAIAQRIVKSHGGWIRAEGAVGKGATFTFTLEQGSG